MAEKITSALVGKTFPPVDIKWGDRDVQFYALAVGAKPDAELDYVYEGRGPKVLPTYSVIPGFTLMASVTARLEMNLAMVLHGEQGITLHRALPSSFSGQGQGRIVEVWDKGKAAVIGIESTVSDEQGPLFTSKATLFIRNAGGFGGERGPSADETRILIPDRAPDHVVEQLTDLAQGALYRLCGDRNPMHIDPQFAQFAGYQRPFLHGLCTYGFAGRAALAALCGGDAGRFKGMTGRFSDQVYPGDSIVTKMWRTAPGEAVMQVETQSGSVVINNARIHFEE